MAGPRKPALYRASHYVSIIATVASLIILAYVGATIYSASQVRPGNSNGNGIQQNLTNAGLELTASINFTNPGFLPVTSVHLASVIYLPDNITILAHGTSPNVSVPAGGVGRIPLTMVIPLGAGSPAISLLTHDAELPTSVWANVSFAGLFAIMVQIPTNLSWGAPFANLAVTFGTPTVTNGSASVPVTLSFNDRAKFGVNGTLSLVLQGSSSSCTVKLPDFIIAVSPQSSFSQSLTVVAPAGCSPPGAWTALSGSFSSPQWSSPLPTEPIP